MTCNCFDTRCYTGVTADFDLYFGINRVIGGTYRPGLGLCGAKISWLKCGGDFKKTFSNLYSDDNPIDISAHIPKENLVENESDHQSNIKEESQVNIETDFSEKEQLKEITTTAAHVETSTSTEAILENLITSTETPEESEEDESVYTHTESFDNYKFTSSINIFDLLKNSSIEALSKLKEEILEEKPEFEEEDNFQMEGEEEDLQEDDRTLNDSLEIKKPEKDRLLSIRENVTTVDLYSNEISNAEEIYGKVCD